jgi:hypothetical protein
VSEVRRFVVTATGDPAALLADLAGMTAAVVVVRLLLGP